MPEPLKPDEINELTKMLGDDPSGSAPASPASSPAPADSSKVFLQSFEPPSGAPSKESGMELLDDVNVSVKVELGRSRVVVQDVLRLGPGSVVPLDTLTGDPLDVYVNDRLVARGEILVVNDNFALRITEVLPQSKVGPLHAKGNSSQFRECVCG